METKRKILRDRSGNAVHPLTDADFVEVTDGRTVQTVLDSLMADVALLKTLVGTAVHAGTIGDRDLLTGLSVGSLVCVSDASDDDTVESGGALYVALAGTPSGLGAGWLKVGPASLADIDKYAATDAQLDESDQKLRDMIASVDKENDDRAVGFYEHIERTERMLTDAAEDISELRAHEERAKDLLGKAETETDDYAALFEDALAGDASGDGSSGS